MTYNQRVKEVTQAIQKAIDSCICLRDKEVDELTYCDIVIEAVGNIEEGKAMRAQELEDALSEEE